MATDELVTCYWCQEDTEDPELVGVEFSAGSGPDGQPLYRCARCGPMAIRAPEYPGFSPELVEAVAFSLGADTLRQFIAVTLRRAER